MTTKPASVLIIGSGPVVIGQAAEFDYAGTQACRALRAEGIRTILVNSNPATIMTDPEVADAVYLEPLTVAAIEAVIARERPEGLLAGLGGQTGLNMAMDLARAGILDRYDVKLLGTPLEAIRMAEDREAFRDLLDRIGQPYAPSSIIEGETQAAREASAIEALGAIGLPAIIRPAFTLGGTGGGIVETEAEYRERVRAGLRASPIGQVMVERCLVGWQEIEYEVMRDADDTCIAVCSMENVDPLGVHTGDSIVVAPVQTLPDQVHQRLRSAALAIIRALGVEGGCNVQFALSPDSTEYAVIEVNPRVSRSLGARIEGHGLSDRARCGADRGRAAARRDPECHHRHDGRGVRAGARLRRRQAAALPVRQVPVGGSVARQPDEGDRRGDGDRSNVRRGAEQGAPGHRAGGRRPARRGPGMDCRRSTTSPPCSAAIEDEDAPIRWLDESGTACESTRFAQRSGGADRAAAVPLALGLAPVADPRAPATGRPGGSDPRRRPGSRPGSSPRWPATWPSRRRSAASARESAGQGRTRHRTPRPPRCSRPPSGSGSATGTSRISRPCRSLPSARRAGSSD